jgi:hypothetical protein
MKASAPGVTIINEKMASRYFPGEDTDLDANHAFRPKAGRGSTIMGIVKDTKHNDLADPPYPQMYGYIPSKPGSTDVDRQSHNCTGSRHGAGLDETSSSQLIAMLPGVESDNDGAVARRIRLRGSGSTLSVDYVFAAVGMLLADGGILRRDLVRRDTTGARDCVRLAFGSNGWRRFPTGAEKGLKLALLGVAIGLVLSLIAGRLLSTLLLGVGAKDPVTFAGLALVVVAVTMLASYLPGTPRDKVDPIVALRYE